MPKTTSRAAGAGGEPPTSAEDPRYRALAARDARFDGQFFSAITSTGIYCRPICPARTPKPENVRFYRTAAAAQAAGFRACKRCRPQSAPEPESGPSRLTEDALQLISSGAGIAQLAEQLQVSERHVRRRLGAEVGASPLALTRNRRDQAARLLLETTRMPISEVAFTAGFGSLRQFNDAIKATFGVTPSALRKQAASWDGPGAGQESGARSTAKPETGPEPLASAGSGTGAGLLAGTESEPGTGLSAGTEPGTGPELSARSESGVGTGLLAGSEPETRVGLLAGSEAEADTEPLAGAEPGAGQRSGALALRAAYRGPHDLAALLSWFAGRALAGVEEVIGVGEPSGEQPLGALSTLGYRRTVRLAHGPAVIGLAAGAPGALALTMDLDDQRDLGAAIAICRDLADLDADTAVIAAVLSADPVLAPLVAARPGLRIPGCADGFEMAVRAVLGQQVSVAAARTLANRIVARHGERYAAEGPLTMLFPTAERLAEGDLDGLGITGGRIRSIRALACAVAEGKLSADGLALRGYGDRAADRAVAQGQVSSGGLALSGRTDRVAARADAGGQSSSGGLTLSRHTDRAAARAALLELPGIGPWTADYLALRALGDPDAFPAGDLVLRQAAARLGLPDTEKTLTAYAERWRPWRGYAALHLWADQAAQLRIKSASPAAEPPGRAGGRSAGRSAGRSRADLPADRKGQRQ